MKAAILGLTQVALGAGSSSAPPSPATSPAFRVRAHRGRGVCHSGPAPPRRFRSASRKSGSGRRAEGILFVMCPKTGFQENSFLCFLGRPSAAREMVLELPFSMPHSSVALSLFFFSYYPYCTGEEIGLPSEVTCWTSRSRGNGGTRTRS